MVYVYFYKNKYKFKSINTNYLEMCCSTFDLQKVEFNFNKGEIKQYSVIMGGEWQKNVSG